MMNIISLGAGVQSSTMALMAAHGEITPMPDCAIFCDTQAEKKNTYNYLDYLESKLPYPVYRVTKGNIIDESFLIRKKKNNDEYVAVNIPAYMIDQNGKKSMMMRQCTTIYKIQPIIKKIREIAQIKRGEKEIKVHQWIGISYDEAHRMKPSRDSFIKNIYPLIKKDMTRGHCLEWITQNKYKLPPRSACFMCSFQHDKEWLDMKKNHPEFFEKAVKYEKDLEKIQKYSNFKDKVYLHRSCLPLDEVEFNVDENQLNLFGNECEGMCGV